VGEEEIIKEEHKKNDIDKNTDGLTNLNYLNTISNNDSKFVKEMVSTFINSIPSSIKKMENNLENKDLQTVGLIAHKIKPSISFMGIDSLKQTVLDIENMGKANKDYKDLKKLVSYFIKSLNTAIEELKEKLKELD
jgi:HPt (histidine-containing phosphotransfer) domain-containing protein